MSIGPTLAQSAQRVLILLEALAQDIPPERFARHANGTTQPVLSNHPAFIYGHLALYAPKVVQLAGQGAQETTIPNDWEPRFAKGAECRDDPENQLYPSMQALISTCLKGYREAAAVLSDAGDALLLEATPIEPLRKAFPTRAVACNFLLNNHTMFHLGQLSAWRRMEGLSSVM